MLIGFTFMFIQVLIVGYISDRAAWCQRRQPMFPSVRRDCRPARSGSTYDSHGLISTNCSTPTMDLSSVLGSDRIPQRPFPRPASPLNDTFAYISPCSAPSRVKTTCFRMLKLVSACSVLALRATLRAQLRPLAQRGPWAQARILASDLAGIHVRLPINVP